MTVRVVRVGGTQAVTTVRIGAATVTGAVLISGIGAVKLDELTDVDGAAAASAGATLVKQADGVWRPGLAAAGVSVVHTQSTPAGTWTVTHALGRRPHAMVLDPTDRVMLAELEYPDTATVVVIHSEPRTGSLHLI